MKLHLPLSLLSFALAGTCAMLSAARATEASSDPTFTANLGNVMYVGDSITHGVKSASYRWALHKIFVDNGISYNAEGIKTGNYSGGVTAGTEYGGVAFNNLHCSEASARAWEIAGRQGVDVAGDKEYTRFDYSNIQNWLGQSTELNKNQGSYGSRPTYTGEQTPDTFFLLIGTNDTLSDYKSQLSADNVMEKAGNNLLGDMNTIVSSMHTANAQAEIVVMTIPCWTQHQAGNNNGAAHHEAIAEYNKALSTWVGEYNAGLSADKTKIKLVDVNTGMLDVASSIPFYGCSSMFNAPGSDGLHPNAQGDLLMAGNLAKAMGYAGRTAGQERRAAEEFAINIQKDATPFALDNVTLDSGSINLGAEGDSSIRCSWAASDDLTAGFTLDLGTVTLGDGAGADGVWNTAQDLSVTLGAAEFYGTLNINEAYIKWGNTVLYSADMSQNTESVRVSWLAGNSMEGLASGYYVWLGDMLIGEALSSTYASGYSGLNISYSGSGNAMLTQLALTTGSYAPTTNGLLNAETAFTSAGPVLPATKGEPQGNASWVGETGGPTAHYTHSQVISGTTSVYNARATFTQQVNKDYVLNLKITSGSAEKIYGNSGDYKGDIWLTISAEGGASSWFAAHGGSGTLTGDANLRLTANAVGGSTVFGAVNATKVTGDVYVELSAAGATFGSFTGTNAASLVGAYETNIDGNVNLVVNDGTLSHDVVGGIFKGDKTIGGKASVYVNGGSIGGDVMGGGYTGTINGGTKVTVTGGSIAGNVYGGGKGGIINAPQSKLRAATTPATMELASSVELTGGTIEGNVYGGGDGGTINGNTGVTVDGSAVRVLGNIDGGSASGTVTGNSVVTLKNIAASNDGYGFDKYAGSISGGSNVQGQRTLVLDAVTVNEFKAHLEGFDELVAINCTNTELTSFGGAFKVSIGDGSRLKLDGASELTELRLGEGATLEIGALTAANVLIDISNISTYTINLTGLSDGWETNVSNITFYDGQQYYTATLSGVDTQAASGQLVLGQAIPEPATATLSLLALAALAARRRR